MSKLKEAKEKYPLGTKYFSAMSRTLYVCSGRFIEVSDDKIHDGQGFLYHNGDWAEIIEQPNQITNNYELY